LDGGDRLYGVGAADGAGSGFGKAEVAGFPCLDGLFDGAGDVLDGHLGVDAVLVEEVDPVGAQPSREPSTAWRMWPGWLFKPSLLPFWS
jgi:hypothetical protein